MSWHYSMLIYHNFIYLGIYFRFGKLEDGVFIYFYLYPAKKVDMYWFYALLLLDR